MIDFSAISQGFNDRQDYNRNKRLDVMKLFEEFKRDNPEATMADFQSFRDQVSGGRNYLKGGVGNDAALKRIVDTNERKRAAAAAAQAQQEGIQKLNFLKQLEPYIQSELLNMQKISSPDVGSPDEYDYGGAANRIKGMFGKTLPFDLDLTNMMSEGNRSRAVQSMVLKKLPQAREYIGDLTDPSQANAGELAALLQVPQTVAQQLLDSATKEYEATQGEKLRALGREITDRVHENAMKRGMTFDAVRKELNQLYGDDPLYNKWKGENLDNLEDAFNLRSGQVISDYNSGKTLEISDHLENKGAAIMSLIEQNGLEKAKQLLKEQMVARYNVDSALVTDDLIDQAVKTVMDAASTMQDGKFNTGMIKLSSNLLTLTQRLLEANKEKLNTYIAIKPEEGGRFTDGVAMKAASTMAEEFEMTDAAMDIILQVGSKIKDGAGISEVQSTLRTALNQAGMTPFSKFRQRQEELLKSKTGMLKPTTFSDYLTGKKSEIESISAKHNADLDELLEKNIPAADKLVALKALSNNLNAVRRHVTNQVAEEGRHAIGMIGKDQGYSWLKPNETYDNNAIKEMLKAFDSITSATKDAEVRLQDQLQDQIRIDKIRPRSRPETDSVASNNDSVTSDRVPLISTEGWRANLRTMTDGATAKVSQEKIKDLVYETVPFLKIDPENPKMSFLDISEGTKNKLFQRLEDEMATIGSKPTLTAGGLPMPRGIMDEISIKKIVMDELGLNQSEINKFFDYGGADDPDLAGESALKKLVLALQKQLNVRKAPIKPQTRQSTEELRSLITGANTETEAKELLLQGLHDGTLDFIQGDALKKEINERWKGNSLIY